MGVQGPRVALHGVANSMACHDDEIQGAREALPRRFRVDRAVAQAGATKGGKMYTSGQGWEYKDQVFKLLDGGAHMYFCGLRA